MSRRVLRWVDEWMAENVRPGQHADVELFESWANELAERCKRAAAAAGFPQREIDEEAPKLPAMMLKVVSAPPPFGGDDIGGG